MSIPQELVSARNRLTAAKRAITMTENKLVERQATEAKASIYMTQIDAIAACIESNYDVIGDFYTSDSPSIEYNAILD